MDYEFQILQPMQDNSDTVYDECLELFSDGIEEGFIPKREFSSPESYVIVFREEDCDDIIGFCTFFPSNDEEENTIMWIDILYISPKHRRTGIGTSMLENIHAYANDMDLDVGLGTMGNNIPMQKLSEKFGYKCEAMYFYKRK